MLIQLDSDLFLFDKLLLAVINSESILEENHTAGMSCLTPGTSTHATAASAGALTSRLWLKGALSIKVTPIFLLGEGIYLLFLMLGMLVEAPGSVFA